MEGNLIDVEGGLQDTGSVHTQEAPSQHSSCHDVLNTIYEVGACAFSVLEDYFNTVINALFGDKETLGEEATLGTMQDEPLSLEPLAYAESRSRQFADWVSSLAQQAHEFSPSDVVEHAEGYSRKLVDWTSSLAQWMREQSKVE